MKENGACNEKEKEGKRKERTEVRVHNNKETGEEHKDCPSEEDIHGLEEKTKQNKHKKKKDTRTNLPWGQFHGFLASLMWSRICAAGGLP